MAAGKHFKKTHSVEIDNCKDLSRLCFVSHDPDIFVRNGDTELLEPEPEPEPEPQPRKEKTEVGEPETLGGYASLPRPCYRVYHHRWLKGEMEPSGVWFHNRRVAKNGEFVDTDHWICDPLEVLASTTGSGDIEHGRLVNSRQVTSSKNVTYSECVSFRAGATKRSASCFRSGLRQLAGGIPTCSNTSRGSTPGALRSRAIHRLAQRGYLRAARRDYHPGEPP